MLSFLHGGLRRVSSAVFLVLLLGLGFAAPGEAACGLRQATLNPEPRLPTVFEPVIVQVSGVWADSCVPSFAGVSFGEGRIEINAVLPEPAVCAQVLTPFEFRAHLGFLPAGRFELELAVVGEGDTCFSPVHELVVSSGAAPVARPAATLLYPYFEVDLEDAGGTTTMISVGNVSSDGTFAHLTLWTDQGYPTYAFDLFLPGGGVYTLNLRSLFAGVLPETGGEGAAGLGCSNPVVVPPLAGEPAMELRRLHTGRPSAATGLCAGSGRRGPGIATGFLTVDVVDQCSDDRFVTPRDFGYFVFELLDPPLPPVAGNRNILRGDLLFADLGGVNVQGLEAVAIPADPERWVAGSSFYRSFTPGYSDYRAPLAANWTSRVLRGTAFSLASRILVWRELTPLQEPIPCDRRPGDFLGFCQTAFVQFTDEAGNGAGGFELGNDALAGLHTVGGEELPTDISFGTVEVENFEVFACPLIPTGSRPLQIYVATLVEAQGRLSLTLRGTPVP